MDQRLLIELTSLLKQAQSTGPMEMIQRLSANNPQAAKQIQSLLSSGQNPKEIVLKKLKEQGIDPSMLFKN